MVNVQMQNPETGGSSVRVDKLLMSNWLELHEKHTLATWNYEPKKFAWSQYTYVRMAGKISTEF